MENDTFSIEEVSFYAHLRRKCFFERIELLNVFSMTVGIIGYGRLGALWARAVSAVTKVMVYDKREVVVGLQESIEVVPLESVVTVDILFLLVPVSDIEQCARDIAPFLSPKTIVVDMCSVKMYPVRVMKRWLTQTQPIITMHPLFGPEWMERMGAKGQRMYMSPVRASEEEVGQCESLLHSLGLIPVYTTPEEHDRQMAYTQALVHFLSRGLIGVTVDELRLTTPEYQLLSSLSAMIGEETEQFFYDMERYNSFAKDARRMFLQNLQRLERNIEAGRSDAINFR